MSAFIYIDNKSLLVVTKTKGLKRITCPFVVVSVQDEQSYMAAEYKHVTEVKESELYKLEYKINGSFYPYALFRLPNVD
jgi:hypothetical protein